MESLLQQDCQTVNLWKHDLWEAAAKGTLLTEIDRNTALAHYNDKIANKVFPHLSGKRLPRPADFLATIIWVVYFAADKKTAEKMYKCVATQFRGNTLNNNQLSRSFLLYEWSVDKNPSLIHDFAPATLLSHETGITTYKASNRDREYCLVYPQTHCG
jgi:hypothetical protein